MSKYNTVLVERRDEIGVVTLNRPGSLNAFDAELRRELRLAVREVNEDPLVRVVILTGAGRSFCAGADLSETVAQDATFRVEDQLNGEYKPIMLEITSAPKPWISAVNGAAAGIGSAFAMVCDLTVMAEDAYLYQAFAAIGLVPDGGASWHLVRTLGRKRAYELIVSGEKIRGPKCLEWGLCNRVVPAEQLMEAAFAWAGELVGKAPLALRYAKQALNVAIEENLGDTISSEASLQHLCLTSADASEGVKAFMEKRAPRWQGR